jgi:hypothetical protein
LNLKAICILPLAVASLDGLGYDGLRDAERLKAMLSSVRLQVMEEGERLSKKQLAQESTIKKLRAELAEVRSEKGSASASLAAERQKVRPLTGQLQCAHPHKVKGARSDLHQDWPSAVCTPS